MNIKLNTGVTVKLFERTIYLSCNAFTAYSNFDYKIAIDEKNDSCNRYYILLDNDIVCGPTNWVDIEEFFSDLYKLFIE